MLSLGHWRFGFGYVEGVGIKIKLLLFLSGSARNCYCFMGKAGRSSNGRTYPSGGYYLGSSPSLPALAGKLAIRKVIWRTRILIF